MSGATGGKRPPRLQIRPEVKTAIYDLRAQGMSMHNIACKLGVSGASVSRVLAKMGDPYESPGQKRCSLDGCERQSMYGPLGYCGMHSYRDRNGIPLDAPLMRAPAGTATPCVIDGCDRPRKSKAGYCHGHARRLKSGGEMVPEFERRMKQPEKCTFPGCTRRAQSRGYCSAHNRQQRVHGRMVDIREQTVWDTCTYSAVHHRCRQLWGRVQQYPCVECGKPAQEWAYDGKDPTELHAEGTDWEKRRSIVPYSRFPEFYMPMCKGCHKRRDMRELHDQYAEFREWRKRSRTGGGGGDEPPF
jgi:hypothetical protein